MRSINISFQHGHIYNSDTKERIIVEENINYIIIFERENVRYSPKAGQLFSILNYFYLFLVFFIALIRGHFF
jgi:hypothetical protein